MIKRFSVWSVNLNPAQGSEQAGTRAVLVISPDPMNDKLRTVIVAPMTTRLRGWPTRVRINHDGKIGEAALDQLRTIDKARLSHFMGDLQPNYHDQVFATLAEMFGQ